VPGTLSVLTTATSEGVAHLLGGVVIALCPAVMVSLRAKAQLWSTRPAAAAFQRRVLPVGVVVEESFPASSPSSLLWPFIDIPLWWLHKTVAGECLLRVSIPRHHPCSLIASSHQMPGRETMIPSLGSPRSPLVDPPPSRFPLLKWRWWLAVVDPGYAP